MGNFIVVPVDFTIQCGEAVRQTQNLALLTGSEVALVHVNTTKVDNETLNSRLTAFAEENITKEGVQYMTKVVSGKNIAEAVIKINEKLNPIFTVMAYNTKKGFLERIGSNSRQIMFEARRPVITVHGMNHRDGCDRIVFPVDLTKETRQKTGHVIRMAKLFGSEVNVVMVHEEETKRDRVTLSVYERQVTDRLKNAGIKHTVDHIAGKHVGSSLIEYSKKVDADLIVIMSQAETGVKEFFMGSDADQILNRSEVPVMVINPKDLSVSDWR